MLRPRDTPTRERKSLDGLWRFALDAEGVGRAEGWWRALPGAREMPVPASYNDLFPDAGGPRPRRRRLVPDDGPGPARAGRASGSSCASTPPRTGPSSGSTTRRSPSTRAATRRSRPTSPTSSSSGAENRVTVVVNNVLTWQSIPPGYVEDTPDGPRQQLLPRLLQLRRPAPQRLAVHHAHAPTSSDVTVVTGLDGADRDVGYEVEAVGADGLEVRVALRDAAGTEVAQGRRGGRASSGSTDVHPWRPGEGYLYELEVELWGDGDGWSTSYPLPVGIRTVEVDGHPLPHQRRAVLLHGLRQARGQRRARQGPRRRLRWSTTSRSWSGSARTRSAPRTTPTPRRSSTTPTGTASWSSTRPPPSGSTCGLAGGVFGAEARSPRSPTRPSTPPRRRSTRRRSAELIARDKNHPCVVLWSIANEPESVTAASRAYFEPLAAEARRLDPSRPVGFVNVMLATAGRRRHHRPVRRGHAQPLLRLVRRRRRPGGGRAGARGRAAGLGRASTASRSS